MTPGRYDIKLTRGVTLDIPILYSDANSVPVNLSNSSIKMQVRENPKNDLIVEFNSELTSNGFILISNAANGQFTIFLTAANSALLKSADARYDLQVRNSEDYVTHLLTGRFTISEDIIS